MKIWNRLLVNFLVWRMKHVSQRHFILALSVVVGILGGLVAILLKNTVHYTSYFVTHGFDAEYVNLLYLAYPLFGILFTVLFVRYFVKQNISHGISYILYCISRKNGKVERHHTYSSMIGSTLTVGFGGSVGLEAPIVLTGSAIGSNLAQMLRLDYKTTTLLIGCGSAAAIAGIFKAPITAVVFALEVLMLDLTISSIIPLLISAATGATVANFLLGKGVVFYYTLKEPFVVSNFPFYIVLGIITGLVSVYFIRTTGWVEGLFSKVKNIYTKIIIGGILLGTLIFFLPPLYGEGYSSLRNVLEGNYSELANNSFFYSFRDNFWIFMLFISLVIIVKVIAMAITTGAGGVGGVFAPSLFIGGMVGFLGARTINYLSWVKLSESNFSLVGMAGMIAGVMGAPLTAVFLIAELTSGYELFIPLIITSTISFLTTHSFEAHSIYTKRLASRGELITHHKDKAVLTLMKLEKNIEKDFRPVSPEMSLGQLVKEISKSHRNFFPVIDSEGYFLGVVLLDHIRQIMFNRDMYDTRFVSDLMIVPQNVVDLDEDMESVMRKFDTPDAWNLPVVEKGKYIGFISKSKMFTSYRKLLIEVSSE